MDKEVKVKLSNESSIRLSENFEKFCERLFAIHADSKSEAIKSFKMKDLQLIQAPREGMTGIEFMEHIKDKGYVPLNALHAEAIFTSRENMFKLNNFLWEYWRKKDFQLEAISFFGSFASNGKRADQFFCFKFEKRFDNEATFMVFENDPTWSSKTDLALVFQKTFIEKFFGKQKQTSRATNNHAPHGGITHEKGHGDESHGNRGHH